MDRLTLAHHQWHFVCFDRERRLVHPLSGRNHVLTLNEATGVLARCDVRERDIALQCAKERDPGANQHRNTSDDEVLNETGLEKLLNGDPTIHVNMLDAARG